LIHSEFLWENYGDPRVPFVKSLCEAVAGANTIIAYNQSFESSRLGELATWLPMYGTALTEARHKLWDLLPVVRRHIYHPEFCGSYSLKKVLPALVRILRYEDLEVPDGSHAGLAWIRLLSTTDADERERLKKALLKYCGQDTRGLACLLWVLSELPDAGSRGCKLKLTTASEFSLLVEPEF
jgi:hypothetical protein